MKFLKGAIILAVAGVLCRLIGVVIRIPLANIVGNYGMGLYQMVFPLYALLLVISSAGIPVAISKIIAGETARQQGGVNSKQVLFNALFLMLVLGSIISALFMIFSYNIASIQGNSRVGIIYIAIAPSVLLVCLISAFRGYFQGLQNMVPTATSQIIEQLVKLVFALGMALVLIKISVIWAVFGAILAVTISEAVALLYLIILYFVKEPKTNSSQANNPQTKSRTFAGKNRRKALSKSIMWNITKTAVPITLMASIFPLILVMDSMLIINLLEHGGETNKEATQLFGIQSGTVHTLINLPAVLGASIATAVVPCVSKLMKKNDIETLRKSMSQAIVITILVSIFFTIFYLVFAETIIDLLYHNAFKSNAKHLTLAGNLLMTESALILLIATTSVFSAMLQGIDKARLPLIALLIGGVAKVVFQFAFINDIGIYAVSVGNVICFGIASILNTIFALKYIKFKKLNKSNALRLVVVTVAFAFAIRLLAMIMPDNRWLLLVSGAVSLGFYLILLYIFKFLRFNRNTYKGEK